MSAALCCKVPAAGWSTPVAFFLRALRRLFLSAVSHSSAFQCRSRASAKVQVAQIYRQSSVNANAFSRRFTMRFLGDIFRDIFFNELVRGLD